VCICHVGVSLDVAGVSAEMSIICTSHYSQSKVQIAFVDILNHIQNFSCNLGTKKIAHPTMPLIISRASLVTSPMFTTVFTRQWHWQQKLFGFLTKFDDGW
jgi:hypothetical protein